ncbi:MAG: M20/M25/M40 family metallo-hydrolase [Desulfocapsaceae bacterium]|nr:M20/M25/M40 family metallo-hydrolase [Desulfocapsaceae bacterium]
MQINSERLARVFTELCEIDSPSRQESAVSNYLQKLFDDLGASTIKIDESGVVTGSDTGNLIISFDGTNGETTPLLLACHMDTVGPAEGVEVVRENDVFTSKGETVLGADDKSGIAAVAELVTILKENNIPHCPLELLFTTCEEIGLRGAKALAPSLLKSRYGYALDSTAKGTIITGAPAANRIKITICGKAAHSGLSPETGINALAIAAEAIARIDQGRIDSVSTVNLGLIRGGTATNIVPERVEIEGEVRSHSPRLLEEYTRRIEKIFTNVVEAWPAIDGKYRPSIDIIVKEDFPVMSLAENEPVLQRLRKAAETIDRQLSFGVAGGGSDANIFSANGLKTVIIPTGMTNVHSTDEYIQLEDMVELTELLLALVTVEKAD